MTHIENYKDFSEVLQILTIPSNDVEPDFHVYRIETLERKNKSISTKPFRQFFFDITLFINTMFDYQYAHLDIPIQSNTLQLVAPRQIQSIHADRDILLKTKGYTLCFKDYFLSTNQENQRFIKEFPFFSYSSLNNVFTLSPQETNLLSDIFERILYEKNNKHPHYREVIRGYIKALLYKIKYLWERNLQNNTPIQPQNKSLITAAFDEVMHQHLDATFKITDFAEMLHLSPKYLSETIKKETGKTAKQLFDETLALEAKILMKRSKLSISEIAHQLQFGDVSNFSKFFKRLVGMSPREFIQSQ